jgi:phosphorylcholine metabolism protein LicD
MVLEVAPQEMPEYCTFQPDFLNADCVKIRDDRTTCIYVPQLDASISQGIFIDVAPLDDVADDRGFPELITAGNVCCWRYLFVEQRAKVASASLLARGTLATVNSERLLLVVAGASSIRTV